MPRATIGYPWRQRTEGTPGRAAIWECKLQVPDHHYDTKDGYHVGVFIYPDGDGFRIGAGGGISSAWFDDLDAAIAAAENLLVTECHRRIARVRDQARILEGLLRSIGEEVPPE